MLALPVAWADAPDGRWQFFKTIILPSTFPHEQLVEFEVDPEVYAEALPGLGDVRIAASGADGEREIPYKLLVAAEIKDRVALAPRLQDLGHVPGEYTSFILHVRSEGDLHSEVKILTSSTNFQRRVSVSGSDDGETWRILEDNGTIFNFAIPERGFSTGDTRVRYPTSSARFLRVHIFDDGEQPLDIEGALVVLPQKRKAQHHHLPLDIVHRIEDPERKQTILLMRAPHPGFPADRISLDIPHRNFYREVAVEGSYDSIFWIPLQSGEILYDFDTPRFVGGDRELRFGESRYPYYRITIFNEDNPPLPVEKPTASGFARKVVFTAGGGETYRLYYGNPEASAPSYELEKLFPYLVTGDLPVAQLGGHAVNPAFGVPAPELCGRTLYRTLPLVAAGSCSGGGPAGRPFPGQPDTPVAGPPQAARIVSGTKHSG